MRWNLAYVTLLALVLGCSQTKESRYVDSPQYQDGVFINSSGVKGSNPSKIFPILWRQLTEHKVDPEPVNPVPLNLLNQESLVSLGDSSIYIYRLGHSSLLLNLHGKFWLIDPVFSERTSPFSWAGPKRYHEMPIALEDLPPLSGVIISHDHYDHLDEDTITKLASTETRFFVPLGVSKHLTNWGVASENIEELDWWQSVEFDGLRLTATPSQHFSGRGLTDSDETLWASWVLQNQDVSLFYSGDSGYFDGFKVIGEKLGPFDLTIMENGAYDAYWPDIHMTPEQTLQAHIDLQGKAMMPVHNGTFDLAFHPWYEPLERLLILAEEKSVNMVTPTIGQPIEVKNIPSTQPWWRDIM